MSRTVTDGCVYCGFPRARVRHEGRVIELPACRSHADLLAFDPVYGLAARLDFDESEAAALLAGEPEPSVARE